MRTSALVRLVSDERESNRHTGRGRQANRGPTALSLRGAILRARQFLLGEQREDGSWQADWQSDTRLPAQFVLLVAYLHGSLPADVPGDEWADRGGARRSELHPQAHELAHQAAHYVWSRQLPSGGWARHPDGPADLSTSVLAYFALKIVGHHPSSEPMRRARSAVMRLGGADRSNADTRLWLAMLGQIPYKACPRPALGESTPLAIIAAQQPVRTVARGHGVRELFRDNPARWPAVESAKRPRSGDKPYSSMAGRLLRLCRPALWLLRRRSLQRAEALLRRSPSEPVTENAPFDAIAETLVALDAIGTDRTSAVWRDAYGRLLDTIHVDERLDQAWPRPVVDTLQDTALVSCAVAGSGESWDHAQLDQALDWLMPHAEGNGPDAVDAGFITQSHDRRREASATATAVSQAWQLLCLIEKLGPRSVGGAALPPGLRVASEWLGGDAGDGCGPKRCNEQIQRVADQIARALLALQHRDGGWGGYAEDRGGTRSAAMGPGFDGGSSPDATGTVLTALAAWGGDCGNAVPRAVTYLRSTQRADGSWDSRGGVRYLHGTSWAVQGLVATGVASDDPAIVAAVDWLLVHQHPSGGWGEWPTDPNTSLCDSVAVPSASTEIDTAVPGEGPLTASQTSWAILALLAARCHDHEAITRGVQFLLETQEEDGSWHEPHFTLCGPEPGVWCRNPLYATAFPLMALSQWAVALDGTSAAAAQRPDLRLVTAGG